MMKFLAGTKQGTSATAIKATDLLEIALTADTTVEEITAATGGMKVLELINAALSESRLVYAITSPLPHVKETIARVLQGKFMDRVNMLVDIVESKDDVGNLQDYMDNGRISPEVVEFVTDLVDARKAELEMVIEPIEPLTIAAGVNLSTDQVFAMMRTRGLFLGASCTVATGEATVLGFDVDQSGTMVWVDVNGKQMKYLASAVQSNEIEESEEAIPMSNTNAPVSLVFPSAATNNNQTKGAVQSMENNNVKVGTPSLQFVAPVTEINKQAQVTVESAVEGVETPWYELTPEERAQAAEKKLQADLNAFKANADAKHASAAEVANSASAQALKALAGSPAAQPQTPAPVVQASATAPVLAVQPTKTQNNGGNVQMTNNNSRGAAVQGRQGSTAFAGGAVSGRQGSTLTLANGVAVAPSVGAAWASVAPVFELPTEEFVGNGNNGQDFVWYIAEAAKYEGQILDLATLAANGFANPHIGITGMKFCTPASVANFYNREVKENDIMWVEVYFGTTSYEFMISGNKASDYKAAIFSRNIARKQAKSGNWYCEYETSRRTDVLTVVQQADGVIREARKVWDKEAKAFVIHQDDAAFVREVGGQGWVNVAPNYGIRVGQQVFIQVMVMFDEQLGLKAARDAK